MEANIRREYFSTFEKIQKLDKMVLKFKSFLCEDYKHLDNDQLTKSRFIHKRSLARMDLLLEQRAEVVNWHIDLEEFLENNFGYDSNKFATQ